METIKGLIWADSEQEVGTRLKRDGYKIYKITLQVNKKKHKWNHAMVVDVTYQLGLLIESGVPLRRALQLLCPGKRDLCIQPYMNRLSVVKRCLKHCEVKVVLPLHWLY